MQNLVSENKSEGNRGRHPPSISSFHGCTHIHVHPLQGCTHLHTHTITHSTHTNTCTLYKNAHTCTPSTRMHTPADLYTRIYTHSTHAYAPPTRIHTHTHLYTQTHMHTYVQTHTSTIGFCTFQSRSVVLVDLFCRFSEIFYTDNHVV